MPEPMFALRQLSRTFGTAQAQRRAVSDLVATIEVNEYVAIVGPSGCGKTTLLHVLGLLDTDYSGELAFRGQDVRGLSDLDRAHLRLSQIGFVFQGFHLLPELSLRENVALPYWRLHRHRRDALERADTLLRRLGVDGDADRKPGYVSGGQLQRAALARAVVNDPAVVLADEPTGNLDSVNAARVIELFARVHADGRTVIIVTHDQAVVQSSQRTLNMKDGRITDDSRIVSP